MNIRQLALPILAAGTLMGCQSAWVANGTPDRPLAAAEAGCTSQADHGVFGAGVSGFMNYRAYIDRCIASHGYQQIPRTS